MHEKTEGLLQTLDRLAGDLIHAVVGGQDDGIREGTVMTVGPPPYRRLDCDGRALAYVRSRPRKRAVRVDVSGVWIPARGSPLMIRSSSSAATLMIRSTSDVREAVDYLVETVARTRREHLEANLRRTARLRVA